MKTESKDMTWNDAVKEFEKNGWTWMGQDGQHFVFKKKGLTILVKLA